MKYKSDLGRSDSLSARLVSFGQLFYMFLMAFPEPFLALSIASLATMVLSSIDKD